MRLLLAGVLLAGVAGCNQYYAEGQLREAQGRWEEAAIQYHLAAIRDPSDPEYQEAYQRANRQVARENMEAYKRYLADKEFAKAYARLVDAATQDPTYPPVQQEQAKWMRVLVSGQVHFDFTSLQENTTVADELRLVVRVNTPNPGETVDGDVDVTTGIFFAENLLYDRPDELLTSYTLNSIGLSILQGKSRTRQFSSR
ncbi:MAG TPA: hypothetical protein VL359_02275, partial [bacterium]|nr:hypothetical protein [bacterium]